MPTTANTGRPATASELSAAAGNNNYTGGYGLSTGSSAASPTPSTPAPAPNAPITTSQPNPATTAINPPTATTTPYNYNTGKPLAPGETQPTTNNKGEPIAQDLSAKYNTALSNAKNSGTTAPQSAGNGSAGVQSNLPTPPPTPYDSTSTDATLADNEAHQQLLSDYAASQSSPAQTESLTQTYQDLSSQLGIPALDTQLINTKAIIDGTEQDIRDEVSKAGGFATNSQVLALTDARNKTMITNYNNLLQTKQDAEQNLTTMMDLTEKDQAYAQQQITNKLNFDQQQITYADKALTNAQSALTTMQKSEGWDGIYKAALATGDPQAVQRINSIMGNGFDLATMAKTDAAATAQTTAKNALDLTKENADIANTYANTAKTKADTITSAQKAAEDAGFLVPAKANQPGYTSTGVKLNTQSAAQQILSNWTGQKAFDPNGGMIPPQFYNQAKSWWVEQGFSASDFDAVMGGYKSPKLKTQYN